MAFSRISFAFAPVLSAASFRSFSASSRFFLTSLMNSSSNLRILSLSTIVWLLNSGNNQAEHKRIVTMLTYFPCLNRFFTLYLAKNCEAINKIKQYCRFTPPLFDASQKSDLLHPQVRAQCNYLHPDGYRWMRYKYLHPGVLPALFLCPQAPLPTPGHEWFYNPQP